MAKASSSGARDKSVTIEQLTASSGASHFPVETWTPLLALFASQDVIGGRERFSADQLSAPFDTVWQVPYHPDIDPDLVDVAKQRRLVYLGRVHDIVHAAQVGRQVTIALSTLARQG